MFKIASIAALVFTLGCMGEVTDVSDPQGALQIETLDDTTFEGTFVYGGSVVQFRSHSADQQFGTLWLDVNGAQIDVTVDIPGMMFEQDGHLNAVYQEDRDALLALSRAVSDAYPDLVTETLFGKLLVAHTDRLADAPNGHTIDHRVVDVAALPDVQNRSAGCGDDGIRCLSGSDGYTNSFYDKSGGSCTKNYHRYGKRTKNCLGRCGSGCSWWDKNYTQDCFDHDMCIKVLGGNNYSSNPNCGDEFWEADDDYVVTYYPWYC